AAAGDYDRDGDLDLFLAHWSGEVVGVPSPHLWRNEGGFQLVPVDFSAGVAWPYTDLDWSFTPSFADLDGDLWPELLVAGDFGTSQVFRNLGPGTDGRVTFEVATGAVITDENGMGSALGDYDGDGDLDWFVSSIWDPDGVAQGNWGVTGNRLYRNLGDGTFEDATEGAGVREGYWGWGSCFADVDNDGDLDIFHTNGFPLNGAEEFHDDPARLFMSNGDGTFTERSAELGVDDTRQGRGVVCFDYDRDGDIDLFVANNGGPPLLYQNRGLEDRPWLALELQGDDGNSQAIGAFVRVRSGGRTQTAFVQGGSQYLSQNPAEVHFGLGSAEQVDEVEIQWPDGEVQVLTDVPTRRLLTVRRGGQPAVEIPTLGPWGLVVLISTLVFLGARRLSTRP
ncbi:MAG: FG-GAP-like repeat-containing protein, partial [Acidobacteriota bacterium]